MALRRGFKSECERIANRVRTELGLPKGSSVIPGLLAEFLDIEVRSGDELVDLSRFVELDEIQQDAFSACTFKPTEDRTVVVLNPISSEGRRSSDLAHELSHVVLNHGLSSVETLGDFTFLTCNSDQEDEANWLSGTLLLPRELLLREAWKRSTPLQIASRYNVSERMASYRLNVTGVLRQVNGRRPRRGAGNR